MLIGERPHEHLDQNGVHNGVRSHRGLGVKYLIFNVILNRLIGWWSRGESNP